MSYAEDLAKLKRAAARAKARGGKTKYNLVCCVCNAKPAPMTRFGPRCEKHAPDPCRTCGGKGCDHCEGRGI